MSAKPENEREALISLLKAKVKVDATGLAPAVIGHYIFGFEEAADAILARQTGEQDRGSSCGLGQPGSGSQPEADVGATAALAPDSGWVRRCDVIDALNRLAEESADLALDGGENARNRESMEAAFTRAKYAVAFLPSSGSQTGEPEPVADADIPALLRVAIRRLEAYDAPSRPAMLDLASHLRGVLEIPHEVENVVRQCASIDTNGYLAEKSAIIAALRASRVNAPAEAQARVDDAIKDAEFALAQWDARGGKPVMEQARDLATALRALISGSTPKPARVEITEEMVERAAVAMTRALGGTSSATIRPARYELQAARATLTAALTPSPSNAGEAG